MVNERFGYRDDVWGSAFNQAATASVVCRRPSLSRAVSAHQRVVERNVQKRLLGENKCDSSEGASAGSAAREINRRQTCYMKTAAHMEKFQLSGIYSAGASGGYKKMQHSAAAQKRPGIYGPALAYPQRPRGHSSASTRNGPCKRLVPSPPDRKHEQLAKRGGSVSAVRSTAVAATHQPAFSPVNAKSCALLKRPASSRSRRLGWEPPNHNDDADVEDSPRGLGRSALKGQLPSSLARGSHLNPQAEMSAGCRRGVSGSASGLPLETSNGMTLACPLNAEALVPEGPRDPEALEVMSGNRTEGVRSGLYPGGEAKVAAQATVVQGNLKRAGLASKGDKRLPGRAASAKSLPPTSRPNQKLRATSAASKPRPAQRVHSPENKALAKKSAQEASSGILHGSATKMVDTEADERAKERVLKLSSADLASWRKKAKQLQAKAGILQRVVPQMDVNGVPNNTSTEYWDSMAQDWDGEIQSTIDDDRNDTILQYIDKGSQLAQEMCPSAALGVTAVDFGCGVCKWIPALVERCKRVEGIDISRRLLEVGRKDLAKQGIHNVQLKRADLANVDLTKKGVPVAELVICANVLISPEPCTCNSILQNIWNNIVPQGVLLLLVPASESATLIQTRHLQWLAYRRERGYAPDAALEAPEKTLKEDEIKHVFRRDGVRTQHYTSKKLKTMCEKSGFKCIQLDPVEYEWNTELADPTGWMGAPYPFDWLIMVQKEDNSSQVKQ